VYGVAGCPVELPPKLPAEVRQLLFLPFIAASKNRSVDIAFCIPGIVMGTTRGSPIVIWTGITRV
jgi:hypothetical protein